MCKFVKIRYDNYSGDTGEYETLEAFTNVAHVYGFHKSASDNYYAYGISYPLNSIHWMSVDKESYDRLVALADSL